MTARYVPTYVPPFLDAGRAGVAVTNSAAQNKIAIDAALADAALDPREVWLPRGVLATLGGHVIPYKVTVRGQGVGATEIDHSGDNVCWTLTQPGGTEQRQGVADMTILGNAGAAAVAIEFRDISFGPWAERVRVRGYTAGVAYLLHNFAAGQFVEGVVLDNCASSGNLIGIRFKRTDGTSSFKGFSTRQFACNVPTGGTAFDFGVGLDGSHAIVVYNADIQAHVWFAGGASSGTGWDVGANATIRDTRVFVDGEGAGSGGTNSIKNSVGGVVSVTGIWAFGQILSDIDPAKTLVIVGGNANFGGADGDAPIQTIVGGKNQAADLWVVASHLNSPEYLPGTKYQAISATGRRKILDAALRTGSANAGSAGAPPAQVKGYLIEELEDGTAVKVPYYAS